MSYAAFWVLVCRTPEVVFKSAVQPRPSIDVCIGSIRYDTEGKELFGPKSACFEKGKELDSFRLVSLPAEAYAVETAEKVNIHVHNSRDSPGE
jgi:hypothetical protein